MILDFLTDAFGRLQSLIFEQVVQPLLFGTPLMFYNEEAYDAIEWFLIGVLEIAALALLMPWFERRWPAEPAASDRREIRTDMVYTFLQRLGAFPLLAFALITPLFDGLEAQLRLWGLSRPNLDQWWPGVSDQPLASFLFYLVVFDLADYWIHRGQHRFDLWWNLHAVHHSQRAMTFWSDNRNHLIDDLLRDVLMAALALLIGVAPGQFVSLIVASRLIQSVQHANVRWQFSPFFERVLVSPSFHRLHHAIGAGHEGPARGCNFAVLFPVWDVVFRTADWRPGFVPTGIRDQLEGRDYGHGFWAQQWRALLRIAGRA